VHLYYLVQVVTTDFQVGLNIFKILKILIMSQIVAKERTGFERTRKPLVQCPVCGELAVQDRNYYHHPDKGKVQKKHKDGSPWMVDQYCFYSKDLRRRDGVKESTTDEHKVLLRDRVYFHVKSKGRYGETFDQILARLLKIS